MMLARFLGIFLVLSFPAWSQNQGVSTVNFSSEFEQFINESHSMDDSAAWIKWREILEAKDPDFFQQVVGGSRSNPDWLEAYEAAFISGRPFLKKYSTEILEEFNAFDSKIQQAHVSFRSFFKDFDISTIPVYASPSLMRFNGQGTEVNGHPALVFGIDTIVTLKYEPKLFPGIEATSNSDILYAHEIFHVFHGKKLDLNEEKFLTSGQLIHNAWLEGLAIYASDLLHPNTSLPDLLMDSKLAESCMTQGDELISKFSKIAHSKMTRIETRELYRNWFLVSSNDRSLPVRAGYCVGYLLVKRIAKSYTIDQMTNWAFEEIPTKVIPYLF